jgi:hypothetical protein
MGLAKTPKVETPPPAPTMEQANTDEATVARQDERKRLLNAVNSRTTILSEGGSAGNGRKTLLGE